MDGNMPKADDEIAIDSTLWRKIIILQLALKSI